MSFKIFWCCGVLSILVLKISTSNTQSGSCQNYKSSKEKEDIALYGVKILTFNVYTSFKDELALLKELINAKFVQHQKEFIAYKDSMANELQNLREKISHELEKIVAKYRELPQSVNVTNETEQIKIQQKSFETAIRTIEPRQADLRKWNKHFDCTEDCGPIMDLPSSCEEAMPTAASKDGVYLLYIENSGLKPFYAYCQRIDNKVWTVMQRRDDASVDFYRNREDYKHGFGNLYGELWLGLDRINVLTGSRQHELHVWLKNRNGVTAIAKYANFSIGKESDNYTLSVSGFSKVGNLRDSLKAHNGYPFSTYDNDLGGCAKAFKGAWWFTHCYLCHLNGDLSNKNGNEWLSFPGTLKYSRMAIRRV